MPLWSFKFISKENTKSTLGERAPSSPARHVLSTFGGLGVSHEVCFVAGLSSSYEVMCVEYTVLPEVCQDLSLQCLDGWSYGYGRCYIVVPSQQSWQKSLSYCQRYGGKLAEPAGYDLTSWLSVEAGSVTQFWIGYRGGSESDLGTWSDGAATTVEVGVWGRLEPDVSKGECAYIRDGLWYTDTCQLLLPAVCEALPCPQGTFRCANGRCVGEKNVCNNRDNCGDQSDERNCEERCTFYQYGTSGQIESPNFGTGSYPTSSLCVWTVEAPAGSRIQLRIDQFDTEEDLDVVEIFTGETTVSGSSCVARLSGSLPTSYQQLISSNNFLIVRFSSDSTITKNGFLLSWKTEFECSFVKMESSTVFGQSGNRLDLSSNENQMKCETECASSVSCMGFSYNPGDSSCFLLTETPKAKDDACCSLYVKTCPGQTGYTVHPTFPVFGNTLTASSLPHRLSTPFYPLSYPGNTEAIWLIQTSGQRIITFKVLHADLCEGDTADFRDGDSVTSPRLTILSHDQYPELFMSTGRSVTVYMGLSQHLRCGGLLLTYQTGCDFQITSDSGEVFTPGHPDRPYPGIATCSWQLHSASGDSLKLIFTAFSLEDGMDYLKIYDGESSSDTQVHSGKGYSGSTVPSPVVSTGSALYLEFSPSAIVGRSGFMATFSSGCPSITDDESIVLSPSSPRFDYQDQVTLRCEPGYKFDPPYDGSEAVSLLCSAGGQWNKQVPFCRRSVCGPPPAVTNGYITARTGVEGGDTVTYVCDKRYKMTGSATVGCHDDGTWEAVPTCSGEMCVELSTTIQGGSRVILRGDGRKHGSVVHYRCNKNFEIVGSPVISCDNGVWTADTPACHETPCPMPYIQNGVLSPNRPLYLGDTLYVECDGGYVLVGNINFLCGEGAPLCVNIDECLNSPCEHDCVDTDGSYTCTCRHGYEVSPQDSHKCQDINECDTHNGYCDHACLNSDGSYRCTCNDGYTLYRINGFQSMYLQGIETGLDPWNSFYINHTCVRIACPTPSLTINFGRATTSQSNFYYGDMIEYLCNVGYVIEGVNSMTSDKIFCLSSGTWSGGLPTCLKASCNLDVVSDANVLPAGPITFEEYYQLDCQLYTGETEKRFRQCVFDIETKIYRTQGAELKCPVADCGAPEDVNNARPYNYGCTTRGCSFHFQCNDLFQVAGSSASGNVTCLETGRWDFGDLHCIETEGYSCTDPGTPYDGQQISTSYELGSLVSFQCDRMGFTLSDPYPWLCEIGPTGPRWNNTGDIPTCQDTTPPAFKDCPNLPIVVPRYNASGYTMPTVYDNSVVWEIDITPPNFLPDHSVPNPMNVVIIAKDHRGNTGICQIKLELQDQVPPELVCTGSTNIVVQSETHSLTVDTLREFISSSPDGATSVLADPSSITIDASTVGQTITTTITAMDAAMNTASCRSQITVTAAACQPWALNVAHASKDCTETDTGRSCIFECESGYAFFEDPKLNAIQLKCDFGGAWDREVPNCQARHRSVYRHSSKIRYIGNFQNPDPNCLSVYTSQLEGSYNSLTTALGQLCTDKLGKPFEIKAPSSSSMERFSLYYETGYLYVTVNLEIGPGGDDILPLHKIPTSGSCPGSEDPTYHASVIDEFQCQDNEKLGSLSDGTAVCVKCMAGYFSIENKYCVPCPENTYGDGSNGCLHCPANSKSRQEGVANLQDCYKSCPPGMFSSTGLAPCTECGKNQYSSEDGTSCVSCPSSTLTRGRGSWSESDCLAPCAPGTFSPDGLQPCTPCPKHFYQASEGSTFCLECESHLGTELGGSTSPITCVDMESTVCQPDSCSGHGTCRSSTSTTSTAAVTQGPEVASLLVTDACQVFDRSVSKCCEDPVVKTDPCAVSPCSGSATCVPYGTVRRTCTCPIGFTGDNCDVLIDLCVSDPCLNGGTCRMGDPGRYDCLCAVGYDGDFCQRRDSGAVVLRWGLQRGQCMHRQLRPQHEDVSMSQWLPVATPDLYTCMCLERWGGGHCQFDVDGCLYNPCENGGECTDTLSDYSCTCPRPELEGKNCEVDSFDACSPGPVRGWPLQTAVMICSTAISRGLDDFYGQNCSRGLWTVPVSCQHAGTCTDLESGATNPSARDSGRDHSVTSSNTTVSVGTMSERRDCLSVNTDRSAWVSRKIQGQFCEIDYDVQCTAPCIGPAVVVNDTWRSSYGGPGCSIPQELCTATYCANGGRVSRPDPRPRAPVRKITPDLAVRRS
ncbi:hypothetical protein ScPMuIL_003193 [Solemya velum]